MTAAVAPAVTMREATVILSASQDQDEWDAATDIIREACGNELPPYWPAFLTAGGLLDDLRQQWSTNEGGTA